MKFIMIRHGETVANRQGRYIGHTQSPYTDKGKSQVRDIVINISENINIEGIYSSPLDRTRVIAEKIAQRLDKKLIITPAISEINFGIFEGKTYKEIKREFPLEWEYWIVDYINYKIPQGECLRDVNDRVKKFIDELKDKGRPQTEYLLITHGGIIQTIITYLLDLRIEDRWHFRIPPGAIVEIDYHENYGVLSRLSY